MSKSIQKSFPQHFENKTLLSPISLKSCTSYILESDIIVDFPEPFPTIEQRQQNPFLKYGFFAAIIMDGNHITLDLNGFTIKMSDRLCRFLRFFSLIELNNSPFPLKSGLPICSKECELKNGKNLVVKNGKLGLSSHSGVHGNNNKNVKLKNLKIENFEVGAIMMNGFENLQIQNVNIGPNSQNVPFQTQFSALVQLHYQLQPFINVDTLWNEIISIVNNESYDGYLKNPTGKIDGTLYGMNLHRKGVAIGSHGNTMVDFDSFSKDLTLQNVTIADIVGNVVQIDAFTFDGKMIRDISGQIIHMKEIVKTQKIDMIPFYQFLGVKIFQQEGITTSPHFIPKELLNWFCSLENDEKTLIKKFEENGSYVLSTQQVTELENILNDKCIILYGGDGMAHVNKGVIALRMDGIKNCHLQNIIIKNISNESEELIHKDNLILSNVENFTKYTGNDTYGIIWNTISNSTLNNLCLKNIDTNFGNSYGIICMNDTKHIKLSTIKDSDSNSKEHFSIVIQNTCSHFEIRD